MKWALLQWMVMTERLKAKPPAAALRILFHMCVLNVVLIVEYYMDL